MLMGLRRVILLVLCSFPALVVPSQVQKPHLIVMLLDDYGWANAAYHRTPQDDPDGEVQTPHIDELVASGVQLDRFYAHKFCSPTRSALQVGRAPIFVNVQNSDITQSNPLDPVSGFQGIPRNMTGIATKLKSAGYSTHMVGKWHAGLATPDHTPAGRGYDTSLLYYDAANDYWDNTPEGGLSCPGLGVLTDLWQMNGPAVGLNNSRLCSQARQMPSCKYEDELFAEHMLNHIAEHNTSAPFFGFIAWHNCHSPMEVPTAYLKNFSFINNTGRALYAAKANFMDAMIGKITAALTARGMMENTLIIASADNGGPLGSANNWPRKGGKFSNWEGGVRVNSFASGGLIPPGRRGTIEDGFAAIDDIYPTLCALAGVDPTDERAAKAGLPPVSGFDIWPLISGNASASARKEVYLGDTDTGLQIGNTVLQGLINTTSGMKVLVGEMMWSSWPGPYSPNGTIPPNGYNVSVQCEPACLFDVINDPNEHNDLAASQPETVAALLARMEEVKKTLFNPDRGASNKTVFCKAAQAYNGFIGPFLS